jgi:hypothetical protein
MEFARSRGGDTGAARLVEPAAQLLNAAKRLEPLDDGLAREAYLEALAAAMYAGRLGEPGALVSVAEAALAAVGRVPTPHRPIDLLLSGMANRIVGGMSAGSDPIRTALQLMCTQAQQADGQALRWMSLGLAIVQESATGELWDDAFGTRGTPVHWPYFHRRSPTARGSTCWKANSPRRQLLSKRQPRSRLRQTTRHCDTTH